MNTELMKNKTQSPSTSTTLYRRPYYTVRSSKNQYTLEVFMPGVSKDDYTVSLHQKELLVEGRKVIPITPEAHWLHRELTPESYRLRLQLNTDVDSGGIVAKSEEGVLCITLPVAKQALPRTIQIQ